MNLLRVALFSLLLPISAQGKETIELQWTFVSSSKPLVAVTPPEVKSGDALIKLVPMIASVGGLNEFFKKAHRRSAEIVKLDPIRVTSGKLSECKLEQRVTSEVLGDTKRFPIDKKKIESEVVSVGYSLKCKPRLDAAGNVSLETDFSVSTVKEMREYLLHTLASAVKADPAKLPRIRMPVVASKALKTNVDLPIGGGVVFLLGDEGSYDYLILTATLDGASARQ